MNIRKSLQYVLDTVPAVTLFAMMLLMLIDVIGRKYFGKPVMGAVEVGELLLLITVYAALPQVSAARDHIYLDLIEDLFPKRIQRFRVRAGNVFCAVVMMGMSSLTFMRAQRTMDNGDTTTLLHIATSPFHFLVASLLLLNAVVHFGLAVTGPTEEARTIPKK